jgi:hypothetical protein
LGGLARPDFLRWLGRLCPYVSSGSILAYRG